MDFSQKKCVPCSGSEKPLAQDKIDLYLEVVPEWQHQSIAGVDHLTRNLKLKNFLAAVDLINKIAELAEAEGHHPNLRLHSYNQLEVDLFTHKIKGLHENDFILAQKIDGILKNQ